MKIQDQAYQKYVSDLVNGTYHDPDNDTEKVIVPDGGSVRVSMMTMDACQVEVAQAAPAIRIAENQSVMDAARKDADRVQAIADHYSAQRQQQDSEPKTPYEQYCDDISNAWRK